ncbi:carbohydrate ABC transporter permease [Paenibacillus qinlingensis]|uniref:Aldouronate transport system permease protein n=1 Tax=Paenibacillus qinlingensis TaxID=1837343 RepID=A0ABU1NW68_9BACL|nr:carbohydrate ABC transporter permease [Paenibacillus qinlingensis]MDR6551724.1 putative aldouronate transport system permease protein [Paenibacillus qinlingensis]
MIKRKIGSRLFDVANGGILVLVALSTMIPFLYIMAVSFSTNMEYMTRDFYIFPRTWVLDSYRLIFHSSQFVHSLFVTVYITVFGSLVNLILTATMAYGLTRNAFGQKQILFLVLFTLMFSAGLIPTYLIVKATGLLNSFWAVILPTAISSFNLIVMRQFFSEIPTELNEAALIDGANEMQMFTRIIIPLSKPALAAFGLFYAVAHWNSYFSAILYINDQAKWPIQAVLRQLVVLGETASTLNNTDSFSLKYSVPEEQVGMAAILVATLPILLVYPFLQKHFTKGVLLGSVKG